MDERPDLLVRDKELLESIPSTGLTVIYEPDVICPPVDIILVHGLKGHPYKTWRATQASDPTSTAPGQPPRGATESNSTAERSVGRNLKSWLRRSLNLDSQDNGDSDVSVDIDPSPKEDNRTFFWPLDLLPKTCKNARILTFGYDSKVTKYTSGPTNMNSIFSHGKDFLFALERERIANRPLIFVAHSLGGILTKEMLALSSTSDTDALKGIVKSTAAVIFLGTPHRGSPELAAIGQRARSILRTLHFQTTAAILNTLACKTTDLERAHEAFCRLWQQYDFRVKTFQEGFGLTGISLSVLGDKVVPDSSSIIGNPREHAETLQANHMEMCRFTSSSDPNYIKVGGEIRSIYLSIEKLQLQDGNFNGKARALTTSELPRSPDPRDLEQDHKVIQLEVTQQKDQKRLIQSLCFEHMYSRKHAIRAPSINTGQWLPETHVYRKWFVSDIAQNHLLLIRGKAGAGKSTLMKEVSKQAQFDDRVRYMASFFINANGQPLEHSSCGVLRALLCQLLAYGSVLELDNLLDNSLLNRSPANPRIKHENSGLNEEARWGKTTLENYLIHVLRDLSPHLTLIFIDALDELDPPEARRQAEFWGTLVQMPELQHLRVCLSCRHFPSISILKPKSLHLSLMAFNEDDISLYIRQRLEMWVSDDLPLWREQLGEKLSLLSEGVFLWVVLVMDNILAKYDEGKSLKDLLKTIDNTPRELDMFYAQMLDSLEPDRRPVALKMFQWVIGANRSLRLDEWHHILAFIKDPPPKSLNQWRESDTLTENDQQLEREIRTLSRGLLEISMTKSQNLAEAGSESTSIHPGAGSLDHEQGSARVVQLMHESVRQFLLYKDGFVKLGSARDSSNFANCHFTIAFTCLDYIMISELDDFIAARREKAALLSSKSSSLTNLSNEQQEADTRQANTRSGCTLERVQAMLISNPTYPIDRWVAESDSVFIPTHSTKSPRNSAHSLSLEAHSQILQDYPALLLYATSELPYHIKMAGTSFDRFLVRTIVSKLQDKCTWDRLTALKEDMRSEVDAIDWIERRMVDSAQEEIRRAIRRERSRPRKKAATSSEIFEAFKNQDNSPESYSIPIQTKERPEAAAEQTQVWGIPPRQSKRPRSIASFSSASSYGP